VAGYRYLFGDGRGESQSAGRSYEFGTTPRAAQ
jgi:hypothetical protein